MFTDRTEAGHRLVEALQESDVEIDVVLAVPRGGLPTARVVADAYDAPLDIVAAKKLGAPNNPEYAIGAAASDGSVWLDEDAIDRLGVSEEYIEEERERAAQTAKEKIETYREGEGVSLEDKQVAIVDDGVATGSTMRACIRAVQDAGASSIVVAVPVGPPDTLDDLADEADEVIAVEEPTSFRAVGAHYRSFGQVTDEEAMTYLRDGQQD